MDIAVVDYKGGNVQSLLFALGRLGVTNAELTADPDRIRVADRVLFPGEGEASSAMQALREAGLDKVLPTLTQPFLGICLGMQLLGRHSAEGPLGGTELLGMLPFDVVRFTPTDTTAKVPHMGWNNLHHLETPLFTGLPDSKTEVELPTSTGGDQNFVYFVHSYYAPLGDYTIAQASYPGTTAFSAGVRHRNFYGVQFHVEKSGPVGEHILENFLRQDL
jgi:glutamine amidotransferase